MLQITRTTPRRLTILHLSQIRFTDALTFITRSLNSQFLDDPAAAAIDRRQLDPHPIADQDPDEIPIHAVRDVRRHLRTARELHRVKGARQLRDDDARDISHIR